MSNELAILVLSCDRYADMWPPFLQQFRRYFPGQHKVYFASNERACEAPGVVPILSGPDVDWSTSFMRILDQVAERKLFVILEDLFLSAPVDAERFELAKRWVLERDAMHIKYWASPRPEPLEGQAWIGVYPPGMPYRATVCGFWDRAYLRGLLLPGENPWNFEILGSYRSSYTDGFFGLTAPLCSYRNMVEKGQWIAASVAWARAESLPLELARRPILRGSTRAMSVAKMWYFDRMMQIPWRWRVRAMSLLRRLLVSY
jgi:hypothetical protein